MLGAPHRAGHNFCLSLCLLLLFPLFLSLSLSSSPQINPSVFLFSSIGVVGVPVSCWCLPPVPRNPHVSRHVETETPRRAVDTVLRQSYRLLCYLQFLCPGITGVSTEGSCHQTRACWGGGQVRPALQHGGEGAGLGVSELAVPTPLRVFRSL